MDGFKAGRGFRDSYLEYLEGFWPLGSNTILQGVLGRS